MSAPTLYEWIGGEAAMNGLISEFYRRVKADDIVGPVFAAMGPDHPAHVAAFVAEVFGGPKTYSEKLGGHAGMIRRHMGRRLTEEQRRRWVTLLMDCYQDLDLPHDPEFASAMAGYFEWGSRLAAINSSPGAEPPAEAPMPKWGWGEVGGPYVAEPKQ